MELKSWYPWDFRHVLSNTLTEEEVTSSLQKPGCSPRFVYGVLMLPTVLKYYIDMDPFTNIHNNMTHATLAGYQLCQFAESSTPVITPSPDPRSRVEGVLIFGLNEHQRNSIYELEAGLMKLVNVEVEIRQCDGHDLLSRRVVDAGAFAWQGSKEGLTPMKKTAWTVDGFLTGSFYENIAQSQRRISMEDSVRSPSPRLSPQQRQNTTSSYSRRYGSSLESIQEEMK